MSIGRRGLHDLRFIGIILTGILGFGTLHAEGHVTQPQYEVTVPRLSGSIKIDGNLDDDAWAGAERIASFTEDSPREGAVPEVPTEVLIGFDCENLYIGLICHEVDGAAIRTTPRERDDAVMLVNDDCVGVMLDPYRTQKGGYELWVNPRGVQVDYYNKESLGEVDLAVDLVWYAATAISEDQWVVEIAIPLKSLRFEDRSQHDWAIDFFRYRHSGGMQIYSWVPHTRDETTIYGNLGRLRIIGELATEKKIDLLPYVIGGADLGQSEDPTAKMGVTGKYRFSSNLIFDWAFKPDYSQIESDDPQIDVNTTFALFYPEKRPFFLERKDFFETPINAVYTRMLNDPLAAVKLAGRLGRVGLGYIAGLDRHTAWIVPAAEQSYLVNSSLRSTTNIVRARSEFAEGSSIGVLLTSRDMETSFNRVAAMDGDFKILENYYVTIQGLTSWTKEPQDTSLFDGAYTPPFDGHTMSFDGERFRGEAFALKLERRAKYLDFEAWFNGLSPTVRIETGYLNENDRLDRGIKTNLTFRPLKYGVESFAVGTGFRRLSSYDDKERSALYTHSVSAVCAGENHLWLDFTHGTKSFLDYRFPDFWNIEATWGSYTIPRATPILFYRYGKGINFFSFPPESGDEQALILSAAISPGSRLNFDVSWSNYILWSDADHSRVYDARTLSSSGLVFLSQHLTARLIVQYSSGQEEIALSSLLAYEPTPFTVFYLGSNHSYNKIGGTYTSSKDDRLFMKMQYLIEL